MITLFRGLPHGSVRWTSTPTKPAGTYNDESRNFINYCSKITSRSPYLNGDGLYRIGLSSSGLSWVQKIIKLANVWCTYWSKSFDFYQWPSSLQSPFNHRSQEIKIFTTKPVSIGRRSSRLNTFAGIDSTCCFCFVGNYLANWYRLRSIRAVYYLLNSIARRTSLEIREFTLPGPGPFWQAQDRRGI